MPRRFELLITLMTTLQKHVSRIWPSLRPLSFHEPVAAVFLFHTVEEHPNPWTHGHRYVTPLSKFKLQITYLKKHFRFVSTTNLVEQLAQGRVTENIAAIHFDDGFRSFKDIALPFLKRQAIPSTLFPIHSVLFGDIPIRNKLAYLLNTDSRDTLLDRLSIEDSLKRRSNSFILSFLKNEQISETDDLVKEIYSMKKRITSSPFMRAEELVALKDDPWVEFGSHTLTHPMLVRLDLASQRREIVEGHEKLCAILGKNLQFFAYPFGGLGHFDEVSRKIIKTMDGVTAFNTFGFLNRSWERTNVHRITLARHSPWQIKILLVNKR